MKKATVTFITTAALALAIPVYATGEQAMQSDSQRQDGLTHQGMQSDSQRQDGMAQQGMKSDYQREGLTQQQSGQMITAEELEGMEVVSKNGEELGEIEKITIDKKSGEVKFVTFSRGGVLNMGGEEVSAPLSAFEIRDNKARLTVDQSKLENVPQKTADATDSDYQRDLENHYGAAATWDNENRGPNRDKMFQDTNKTGEEGLTQQQSGKMITAEELEGMEVVSQEGEELGEIEKITIDKQSGEVKFVTFSRGGILGMGGEEIAAPLSAFEIRDNKARLTVSQTKIDNVPQKTADATDSDYQRDLESHYGVAPAWDNENQGATDRNEYQDTTKPGKVDTKY